VTQYPQSGIPGQGPPYGQYPASGYGQPSAPLGERPRPLVIAVWLMYVAAVVEIVYAVADGQWLASYMSSLFTAIEAADTSRSGSQVPTSEIKDLILVIAIVGGIVAVLIWLWIAWKNRAGRNWARVVATVFFGLSCLGLPELLTGGHLSTVPSTFTTADGATIAVPPLAIPAWLIAVGVVNWLLGLAIIILLWQRAASWYYEAVTLSRRRPAYAPYAPYAPYAAPGYGAPGYAPPGYAPPGYAPPGSPQWQPYGQPPAAPQDPQAPPRPPLA
jgi:hypothetical protein